MRKHQTCGPRWFWTKAMMGLSDMDKMVSEAVNTQAGHHILPETVTTVIWHNNYFLSECHCTSGHLRKMAQYDKNCSCYQPISLNCLPNWRQPLLVPKWTKTRKTFRPQGRTFRAGGSFVNVCRCRCRSWGSRAEICSTSLNSLWKTFSSSDKKKQSWRRVQPGWSAQDGSSKWPFAEHGGGNFEGHLICRDHSPSMLIKWKYRRIFQAVHHHHHHHHQQRQQTRCVCKHILLLLSSSLSLPSWPLSWTTPEKSHRARKVNVPLPAQRAQSLQRCGVWRCLKRREVDVKSTLFIFEQKKTKKYVIYCSWCFMSENSPRHKNHLWCFIHDEKSTVRGGPGAGDRKHWASRKQARDSQTQMANAVTEVQSLQYFSMKFILSHWILDQLRDPRFFLMNPRICLMNPTILGSSPTSLHVFAQML